MNAIISTTVISEPDVDVCEGKDVVLTCVLNAININIHSFQWFRFIKDTGNIKLVKSHSNNIVLSNKTEGSTLTSSLNISDVKGSHAGYFYVRSQSNTFCNTSLTVLTSMCICVLFVVQLSTYIWTCVRTTRVSLFHLY